MSLKLNSSGGGSVLLQEPSTASNRTLTLPDATTTVVGTDATQTLSNKTFSGAQTFGTASFPEPSGSAPIYGSRAWVNFNGTGTVAIRASGNVSSITDNGTGVYTVNFTTAMTDANYAVSACVRNTNNGDFANVSFDTDITTAATKVNSFNSAGASVDVSSCYVSIFR